MRILSLNAWGGRLYEHLLPYLRQAAPDVLCLQEVLETPHATSDWVVYRDDGAELRQRANLFSSIADAFPSHHAFFCPAAQGEVYDGDRRVPSQWGLATFVRRTYPVIAQVQDFVHGSFSPDGWGLHPRARNAHVLRIHAAAGAMTIAQMHGLRDLSGKNDTPARHAQATRFADMIDRVRHAGDRLVVCGDFNVLPGSATLSVLQGLGLRDLVSEFGHDDTRTSFYAKTPRFADYMLVSANAAMRSFDVVRQPKVSDHRALLLDLA